MNILQYVLAIFIVLQQNAIYIVVRHLYIAVGVATIHLLLISEHEGQWGMEHKQKNAFRVYMNPVG
jgi:hypothetical protein